MLRDRPRIRRGRLPCPEATVPTLRTRLAVYFATRARPQTGVAFIRAYEDLGPETRARLDREHAADIRPPDLTWVLSGLPLGRCLTSGEVGDVVAQDGVTPPLLTDVAVSWLLVRSSIGSLVAALLACRLSNGAPSMQQGGLDLELRLTRALEHPDIAWDIDEASLVRVARLLAAARGDTQVMASTLSDASILLMPRAAFRSLHRELGGDSSAWQAVRSAFAQLRTLILEQDPDAVNLVLIAGLFPRDGLVRLPRSLRIADVRFGATSLGFVYPGPVGAPSNDPLEGAPQGVHDTFILTHMLWPALRLAGITIPWRVPTLEPAPWRETIGTTPADGGWREVLTRVLVRYGLEPHLADYGYTVEGLLDVICGPQLVAAASATDPVLPAPSVINAAANASAELGDAAASGEPAGPSYQEVLASIRAQGVRGHKAACEELAFLCDARVAAHVAPRVLLLGPSGVGKSTLMASLALALDRPYVRVDASAIGENGWAGVQVSDLAALAYRAAGGNLARAERSVIALDDLDKVSFSAKGPGREWEEADAADPRVAAVRMGRQQSLLALLDTGPGLITFSPTPGGPSLQLRTRHLVVICAGVFRDLAAAGPRPSDRELEQAGLIPELAARLTSRLVLHAATVEELVDLYTNGPDGVVPSAFMCKALGYALVVAPEAVRLVASATAAATGGMTPRSGAALITAAVRRALGDVLFGRLTSDGTLRIGPDEILRELAAWGSLPGRTRRVR